jgi:hypothetical protein
MFMRIAGWVQKVGNAHLLQLPPDYTTIDKITRLTEDHHALDQAVSNAKAFRLSSDQIRQIAFNGNGNGNSSNAEAPTTCIVHTHSFWNDHNG